MTDYLKEAEELFRYTQELRRDFHQHPELGFQEVRTAGIVARELNELGLEVTTGVAKTGVVAILEGEKPGPTVLMRFDMDALPIHETTGADYASQNPGVMHACGHDAHTAIGLTVARLLNRHRDELAGRAKFVFQPAEEGLGGAQGMIDEGVLEDPRPDAALALHVWNAQPFGWMGVTDGPAMAAAAKLEIEVIGKGTHGALPHTGVDPVLAASQIVVALQSVVARNVAPLESAVVSLTMIHGGDALNVIPPAVKLGGSVRTYTSETQATVFRRIREIATGIGEAMGCRVNMQLAQHVPAMVNHPKITGRVQKLTEKMFPGSLVTDSRVMGSEDMALMMQDIPGCYFFVGSANAEEGLDAPHHNPNFDIDERALPRGAGLMAAAAADLLSE